MPKNMPVYIAAAGPDIQAAAALSMRCAYLAYSIGPGGALNRSPLPARTRGGLLGLSDHDAPPLEGLDPRRLEQETAERDSGDRRMPWGGKEKIYRGRGIPRRTAGGI